jgi:hypothetical protein
VLTWWRSPVLVFVRSRGAGRALAVALATTVAGALVPTEPVPVKFRLAAVGLGPLVAALPGAFLPTLLEHPEHQLEPTRAIALRASRIGWLAVLLVVFTGCGELALGGGPGAVQIAARSLALTGGIGLLTAQLVPALTAWLPGSLLVVLTLMYGTASVSGRPYRWALLLSPAGSPEAGLTAAALLLAGSVLYVWRDGRSSQ